jgi:hypothetical protein
LQKQFGSEGARSLLVSAFYGERFSDRSKMSHTEEIAYDKSVWIDEDSVVVPIALAAGQGITLESWRKPYAVMGIPMYYFVDRAGIIRYAQWQNPRNIALLESRFAAIIKKIIEDDAKLSKTKP